MKKIMLVLTLLSGAVNVASAQHLSSEVPIPSKWLDIVNILMEMHDAHLDVVTITENLSDGHFTSVTGDFMVSCFDGRRVHVEGVVSNQNFLSNEKQNHFWKEGFRPMTLDETIASMMSRNRGRQEQSISTVIHVLEGVCSRSIEQVTPALYANFSLWAGVKGDMVVFMPITGAQFAELSR